MTMITPAGYYGLPAPPPPAPNPSAAAPAPGSPTTAGAVRKGLHQDPVAVLLLLVALAFLLARAAEHGLSFGFKVNAK